MVRASARESRGRWIVERRASRRRRERTATTEPAAVASETPPSTTPWHWAVGEIRVADAALDLEDRALSPAVQLNLAPIAITVAGLSSEPGAKMNVTADAADWAASRC